MLLACPLVVQGAERPGDGANADALRQHAISVTAIQRNLLAMAESASRDEQFELYRSYDDSMGTWLQVEFLRSLLEASITAPSTALELRFRTDLRDQARYAVWELEQSIGRLDASIAEEGPSDHVRLIKSLRALLVETHTIVVRLSAE